MCTALRAVAAFLILNVPGRFFPNITEAHPERYRLGILGGYKVKCEQQRALSPHF